MRDAVRREIDPEDLEPGLGEGDRERQADVAQADDGYAAIPGQSTLLSKANGWPKDDTHAATIALP